MLKRPNRLVTRNSQRGNITLLVVVMMGLFLIAAVGIAVDLSNIWLHHQAAQTAADAACTAGVMDMLQSANETMEVSWWNRDTAGDTELDCTSTTPNSAKTVPAPCWYAARNGYASPGLPDPQPTNTVKLTFRSNGASWGATTEPGDPGFDLAGSAPFLEVEVVDRVQVHFLALVGPGTMNVPARAGCGLQLAEAPIPIIVLDPQPKPPKTPNSTSGAMSSNGTGSLRILGGPVQSIQVNSVSPNGIANQLGKTNTYGGPIDLTQGGPKYNGSSLGLSGGPLTPAPGFKTANSGSWMPTAPVNDPFASIVAPGSQGTPAVPKDLEKKCTKIEDGSCKVAYGEHGCPDHAGCTVYTAGDYPGIQVKGGETAIFDPGVYYMQKSLWLASNSIVRTNTAVPGDGSSGTMFYLTGTPTGGSCKDLLCVEANAGVPKSIVVDTFDIYAAECPAPNGKPTDPELIKTLTADGLAYTNLNGNLLLAPCGGPYGDPSGTGAYRGMLFFADRSLSVNGSWSGGGQSLMAGNAYFHNTTDFSSNFILQGNSCSSSYIIGEIVTDRLDFGGNPCINMVLNPNAKYPVLKATMLK